jgi:hypothetical protein
VWRSREGRIARSKSWSAIAAIALAACAGMDPGYRAAQESWRGASFDEVVAAWGPPNRSLKSGSQENHTWVSDERLQRGASGSGVYGGVGVGRGGGGGGVGGVIFGVGGGSGTEAVMRCERALVFRDGRVIDEDWTGDQDFCMRFARRR